MRLARTASRRVPAFQTPRQEIRLVPIEVRRHVEGIRPAMPFRPRDDARHARPAFMSWRAGDAARSARAGGAGPMRVSADSTLGLIIGFSNIVARSAERDD